MHADDNLLERVTTGVHEDVLVVGNTSGSFTSTTPMYVDVTVQRLDHLTLSGSGNVHADAIRAHSLTVLLSGSGVVQARGIATRLDVSLTGSGDAQLQQLVARDVKATVAGSGRILVTATQSLDAAVPGSGAIMYGGTPAHVTKNVSGSGAISAEYDR